MKIMEKKNFFVKRNDILDLNIFGEVFKFKRVDSDDELDWVNEYSERHEVDDLESPGKKKTVIEQNLKKLTKCKLRNIIEVPFSKEELKEISGVDKDFKDYSNADKDLLFGLLNPKVCNELVRAIDLSKQNKKKT